MASIKASARELIRHMMVQTGLYETWTWARRRRGGVASHLAFAGAQERFTEIYRSGVWQHGDADMPGSGAGSTLQATLELRRALPDLLDSFGIKTLLDVGCGDFTWMRHVPLHQHYVGVDIVEHVIAQNIREFSGPGREFHVVDGIKEELPDADAVLCREILFHLSFADGRSLLRNLLSKPRRLVIITSDRQTAVNADIPTGDFRLLNLERRPFRFPTPVATVDDSAVCPDRIMGVWRAEDLYALL